MDRVLQAVTDGREQRIADYRESGGRCPACLQQIPLRVSGAPDIIGTFRKHRDAGRWCEGGGKAPNPFTVAEKARKIAEHLSTPEQDLADWWRQRCEGEIDMVVAKAIEYGATDLRDLGRQIMDMAGRLDPEGPPLPDGYLTEVGIVFYAQGKLARIVAAIKEGRRPSADSWLDLGVYARMAQRVHDRGGWPGV